MMLPSLRRAWKAGKTVKPEPDWVPYETPFRELHQHLIDVRSSLEAAVRCHEAGDWPMVRMHLILLDNAAEAICSQANRELAYRHGLCSDETGPW